MSAEKRVLLIVSGGIAAYKSLDLIRRLRERGIAVRCVLTEGGGQFVTPLSLSALCEDKVYGEIFSLTDESEMGHIQLSRSADLLVVAAPPISWRAWPRACGDWRPQCYWRPTNRNVRPSHERADVGACRDAGEY